MKLTKKQVAIIKRLNEAQQKAMKCYAELLEYGKKEIQFDYVNCPQLSDAASSLLHTAEKVEKIVYQN